MLVLHPRKLTKLPTYRNLVLAHLYGHFFVFQYGKLAFELCFSKIDFMSEQNPDLSSSSSDSVQGYTHHQKIKPAQPTAPKQANPVAYFKRLWKDVSFLGLARVIHGGKRGRLPYLTFWYFLKSVPWFTSLAAYERANETW